jgi:hypothetical protein
MEMANKTLFVYGLALFLGGIVLQLTSASLATVLLDPSLHTGTQAVYVTDTERQKIYLLISKEVAALGVVLISISAWRGSNRDR